LEISKAASFRINLLFCQELELISILDSLRIGRTLWTLGVVAGKDIFLAGELVTVLSDASFTQPAY
jgi:hypothetical protein